MSPESNLESGATARPDSGAFIFVLAVWAVMSLATFCFVAHYSDDLPHWDEWSMTPYLAREAPITWHFLWIQHNEHRLPLAKLCYFGWYRLTGGFRAGILANVALLSVLSLLLLLTARRARGATRF